MNTIILTENSIHKNFIIDNIYKIYEVQNVSTYSYEDFKSWKIELSLGNPDIYYFIIDTLYDDAFGHWVLESAIYLPVFNKLKELYPKIKLLLRSKKTYKTIFCDYFNIKDVCYEIEPNNTCFFPSPITAHNDNTISNEYKLQFYKFREFFSYDCEQKYDFVILPRQTKENFKNNDRTINLNMLLNQKIENSYILNTDKITKLKDQIDIIKSGNNIIVTEGAAFYINSLFCSGKTIYVVDITETYKQQAIKYVKLKFFLETYKEKNNVIYISQTDLIKQISK